MLITTINSIADIKAFVHYLIHQEHLNFHTDTSFEDYANNLTGEPYYSPSEASVRNQLLDDCLVFGEANGFDAHELMCDYASELLFTRLMPS
jgi:hypothetical protein